MINVDRPAFKGEYKKTSKSKGSQPAHRVLFEAHAAARATESNSHSFSLEVLLKCRRSFSPARSSMKLLQATAVLLSLSL